jgi:hypothetical protein
MKTLVFHAKHDDGLYDASTEEAFAKACLAIAKDLDDFGAYQEEEVQENPEVDFDALPEPYRTQAINTKARIVSNNIEALRNNKEVAEVKSILAANDPATALPRLWTILNRRSRAGYEYEGVEIVTTRSA